MQQAGITIQMKDTQADPRNREELVKIGGKGQVPCLVIDGQALYESNDIIEWFKKNWK
jgi:glutathione S-transferase